MKIRELINEVGPSLVDLIRTTVVPTQGDQSKNQNATVRPKTGQTSIGPLTPSQASAQQQPGGGTQTSQDGVPPLGTTNQTATGQQPTVSNQQTVPTSSDLSKALKPGTNIDLGTQGKAVVGQTTAQGVEIDATKIPTIGTKVVLPIKSIMQPNTSLQK